MRDELPREKKINIIYEGLFVLDAGGRKAFGVWFEKYYPEEGVYALGEYKFVRDFYRQIDLALKNGFVLFDFERHPEKVDGLLREVERE